MALIEKIKAIADAIRGRTGSTGLMSLDEMAEMIEGMEVGGEEVNTYILVDENGVEVPAVLVDEKVTLTATTNDIRIGTTAVTEEGVVTGEKEIPAYHTSEGYRAVPKGSKFTLPLPDYDYTKLQAIFCPFNTSMANSVAAEKVAIENKVYPVQSTTAEASVTKDATVGQIDFGITNNSSGVYLIRYFSYKEIY
jgi:hypothetical protein